MTYSIVAFDAATGELDAAVQSHWFCVGPFVAWVRPGVGAVCTQSIVDPAYGPVLLDRLAAGERPQAALGALVTADAQGAELRQVAVVDARGESATHTGARCVAFAGHATGAGEQYERALALAPDNPELLFWAGLADVQAGNRERGLARVRAAIDRHSGWADLLARLGADVAPSAATVRAALAKV